MTPLKQSVVIALFAAFVFGITADVARAIPLPLYGGVMYSKAWSIVSEPPLPNVEEFLDQTSGSYAFTNTYAQLQGNFDLGAGTIGGYSDALGGEGQGSIQVRAWDVLTFNFTGSVAISITLEGQISCRSTVAGCGPTVLGEANVWQATDYTQLHWETGIGFVGNSAYLRQAHGLFDTVGSFNESFPGALQVIANVPVLVMTGIDVYSNFGGTANFLHTASLDFQLPTGGSFQSASGVFLTNNGSTSAPAPATLSLLAIGLAAIRIRRSTRN